MEFLNRNLYLRAMRNVELADKAEQERKVAEEYAKLQLLSQPSTKVFNPDSTSVAVATGEIVIKPKKRNVKK